MRKTTFFAALLGIALLWSTVVPDAQAWGRWRNRSFYYGGYPAYYGGYYAPGYRSFYSYPGYYGSYYGSSYPGYYGNSYSSYYPGYYGGYGNYGYVNTPWFSVGW